MLTLLLGPDDYGKKEYIGQLAAKEKAQVVLLAQPENLPLGQLLGQDLFAAKKIFVLQEAIKLLDEKNLADLISTQNSIVLQEGKIDKRSTFNKSLFANKGITVKDFPLPHGKELNTWIQKRVRILGGDILPEGADMLAVLLGRDEAKETKFGGKVVDVQEVYTLLEADSELHKLLAYAAGETITPEMARLLVSKRTEPDVLSIVNNIGENNRTQAFKLMELFLSSENISDEKGKIILLNALLSEQFRNVAIVQDFLNRHVVESEILQKTGWKSGRLFVIKKIAAKFNHAKVLDLLNKLSLLDEELKTSSTPPRVLLDLIFSQL